MRFAFLLKAFHASLLTKLRTRKRTTKGKVFQRVQQEGGCILRPRHGAFNLQKWQRCAANPPFYATIHRPKLNLRLCTVQADLLTSLSLSLSRPLDPFGNGVGVPVE